MEAQESPERYSTLPEITGLLSGLGRLLISSLLCQAAPQWRVCGTCSLATHACQRAEMLDGEEEGQGFRAGLVENESCAVCIQSQEGGDGRRESGGELGGGKWRPGGIQVSDPVTPVPLLTSLLFLFSGINQCLPSPTHHFTNFKRYN